MILNDLFDLSSLISKIIRFKFVVDLALPIRIRM
jgi:hypothetical protein